VKTTGRAGTARRRVERIFVLRMWREAGAEPDAIRMRLSDLTAQEHYGFSSLDDLAQCLRRLLDVPAPRSSAEMPTTLSDLPEAPPAE
jgi:uncharacterized protein (DUF2336 family)